MIKRQDGFTMVELLVTMVIFVLTIAAATSIFVPLLTQFKQQSKIAETQIEGLVGLETLRRDIEQAGFGLPWVIPASVTTATYSEAAASATNPSPNIYNDTSPNTLGPPRPIVTGNNVVALGNSDYLVVKATSISTNDAAMRWNYVVANDVGGKTVQNWGALENLESLVNGYRAIVLIPTRGKNNQRILVTNGANYSVIFNKTSFDDNFSPTTQNDLYLIYGVDPDTDLRMPFNRADYYIRRVAASTPARCAKGIASVDNTGVLVKSLINQADGARGAGIPLLDCVADMQVIFRLDRDGDGTAEEETDALTNAAGDALTAQEIRQQLKEVRVYILSHEGQKDTTFTYCVNPPACDNTTIAVGEFGLENNYDLALITDWKNYRWKVHRIVVKPNNLG